jgi:prepilin-type N-terminal cleavage/methylation domain-containing protein
LPMHVRVTTNHMRSRLRPRNDEGFGLIELMIAMTVLAVGILALFAMFESGIRSITRASTLTTAAALADKEIESFRAIRYVDIGLPDGLVSSAASAAPPYSSDSAYRSPAGTTAGTRVALAACGTSPCSTKVPVQTLTGADGRSYRVDTYVTWQAVGSGRLVKLVTIVVREANDPTKTWARTASAFDLSTGT